MPYFEKEGLWESFWGFFIVVLNVKKIGYVSFLLLYLFVIRGCDVYAICVEFKGQCVAVGSSFPPCGS